MIYKYDLFISYATENREIANYIVEKIESKNNKCFIAPRDIQTGAEYAEEIVNAIANSSAVLLVFSQKSNKSHYVLREINSAVSRNKTIIPLRIEDFLPSEAMEFYLGPTHWLDAYPEILDIHLDKIINIFSKINNNQPKEIIHDFIIKGPELLKIQDVGKINLDYNSITMKEIEIDYLCIPSEQYEMNETTEGTFDEWKKTTQEYENDTSILMIKNDEIIGYCDMYPVTTTAYKQLIAGEVIIRDSMIDMFCLGGDFDVYIAMIGIIPHEQNQSNYLMIFDWIFNHICDWENEEIHIKNIGISVYSNMLEKFVEKFGFEFKSFNPAKGKVYETSIDKLKENSLIKKRYPRFLKWTT